MRVCASRVRVCVRCACGERKKEEGDKKERGVGGVAAWGGVDWGKIRWGAWGWLGAWV